MTAKIESQELIRQRSAYLETMVSSDGNAGRRCSVQRETWADFLPSFSPVPVCVTLPHFGGSMANLSNLVKTLRKERDRVEHQLSALNAALTAFMGVYGSKSTRKRRKLSAKARAKIAAAQRARWAKVKGRKVVSIASSRHSSRHISPAGRARIAAAARARWAKVRAKQKS